MKDRSRSRKPGSGFHRRDFLKGSSAAAAATALATAPAAAEEATAASRVVGPGMTPITLSVNGKDQEVQVEPRMTLLEALRYGLNLTGAKPVSTDGCSGASTVMVDGKPMSASTLLAMDCIGKEIMTVESLGDDDSVVQAFVHNDGMQCGFCTPGFVVAVRAFLDKNPNASDEEIREGLNGNICRCGTYANVIMAATEVVKGGPRG